MWLCSSQAVLACWILRTPQRDLGFGVWAPNLWSGANSQYLRSKAAVRTCFGRFHRQSKNIGTLSAISADCRIFSTMLGNWSNVATRARVTWARPWGSTTSFSLIVEVELENASGYLRIRGFSPSINAKCRGFSNPGQPNLIPTTPHDQHNQNAETQNNFLCHSCQAH